MRGFSAMMRPFSKPSEAGEGVEARGGSDMGEKETAGRLPPAPDTFTIGGHGKTKVGMTSRIAGPGTVKKGF